MFEDTPFCGAYHQQNPGFSVLIFISFGRANYDLLAGDAYATDTPLWSLRLVPSVCGSLLIPLSYNIIRQLGYNGKAALLTASCFLLDNALVTASRFVMTDSVNLCLVLLALFCILKFISCAPLSGKSILWGLLSGLTVGLAVSTKYVSFPCAMLYGWIVARHFWKTIDDLTIGAMKLLRYFGLCITVVSLIPLGIYVGCFVVHLAVLKKAGPYDTMMSSRFQASLEVGYRCLNGDGSYSESLPGSNVSGRREGHALTRFLWKVLGRRHGL